MKTHSQLEALFRANSFEHSLYNDLLDIDDAKAILGNDALLDLATREMRALFVRHGVENFCGMNLLHRHWSVGRDELPVQIRETIDDAPAMVTQPFETAPERAIAASWFVAPQGGAMVPFEFSTDARVLECAAVLAEKPDFFVDARDTLVRHGLETTFGICIAMREPLSNDPTREWFETSGLDRRSVVTAKQAGTYADANLVQTVWIFADANASTCVTACVQVQKCVQVYNGPDDFKHVDGGKKHEKGHDKTKPS